MKRALTVLTVLAVCLCFAAPCTAASPENISEPSVTSFAAYGNPSADQIRDAIIRAGTGIGWQMTVEGPGAIVGFLQNRSHTVTVDIPYSTDGYAIKYRTSTNMNAGDGKIHPNYNRRVDRLSRNILAETPRPGAR